MTMNFSDDLKAARSAAIQHAIDAAQSSGKVQLYAGERPAPGGNPPGALLIEFVLNYPCGIVDSSGLYITAGESAQAVNNGVAVWGRVTDGNGNWVIDGDVKELGDDSRSAEFELDILQFRVGAFGNLTAFSIGEGG